MPIISCVWPRKCGTPLKIAASPVTSKLWMRRGSNRCRAVCRARTTGATGSAVAGDRAVDDRRRVERLQEDPTALCVSPRAANVEVREATLAAREKQKQIKEKFRAWVFADPERTELLAR